MVGMPELRLIIDQAEGCLIATMIEKEEER